VNLSDNYHKRTQTNTVVVQQKEMDHVGFEPTTAASFLGCYLYLLSKGAAALERELYCSNPTQSIFINWVLLA
jgi:hypothetical protein